MVNLLLVFEIGSVLGNEQTRTTQSNEIVVSIPTIQAAAELSVKSSNNNVSTPSNSDVNVINDDIVEPIPPSAGGIFRKMVGDRAGSSTVVIVRNQQLVRIMRRRCLPPRWRVVSYRRMQRIKIARSRRN